MDKLTKYKCYKRTCSCSAERMGVSEQNSEACKGADTDKKPSYDDTPHKTAAEKAVVLFSRGLFHYRAFRRLKPQRNGRQAVGNKVYKKYLRWKQYHWKPH